MLVRPATAADIPAITAIYRHHVLHGLASFEIEPPDAIEMADRYATVIGLGLPWLVAEDDGVLREPFARIGGVRIEEVRPRRRRRSALKRRRPALPLRRRTGKLTAATPVYRGEREIIARN